MSESQKFEYLNRYMPYPFYEDAKQNRYETVYGQIYLDEFISRGKNEGGTIKVSISLRNDKMLNMEYEALDSPRTPLFFYEFIGEATYNDRVELTKRIVLNKGEDDEYYVLKMMLIDEHGESGEAIFEDYKNRLVFIGDVLFSASPILSYKVAIVVEGLAKDEEPDAYNKMKAIYDAWSVEIKNKCICDRKTITTELDGLFGNNLVCKSVRIYNVGQANCCYCDLDTVKFFFDIGVTRSQVDRESYLVNKAIQEISGLDVAAVILSHWDLDHILGVCYNRKCLAQKIWLVPDFEKLYPVPRLSIKRVCNYLLKDGKSKILMIDTTEKQKTLYESRNKAIGIYMGTPKLACGINEMNNGGLILKLENRKNILLPGDCENSIIPAAAISAEFDNVLISHHGSVMSNPQMQGKRGRKNVAYLSCGNKSGNCKIDEDIRDKYRNRGFRCLRNTKNLKKRNKYTVML